jgi:F-type H+-transporting ATPase subunit b
MGFLAFAEGGIQLLPDGTLLIHIVMILAMIAILNRTFFRPINKIIESRVKHKGGRFTEAEKILNEAAEKQAHFESALLGARSDGYELVERERGAAVAEKEREVSNAKAEVAQMSEAEHLEIAKQTEAARSAIAVDAKKMAEKISSNILKAA